MIMMATVVFHNSDTYYSHTTYTYVMRIVFLQTMRPVPLDKNLILSSPLDFLSLVLYVMEKTGERRHRSWTWFAQHETKKTWSVHNKDIHPS